jgi:hypothetical protein
MILPALAEATSPLFRPVKYSLFPPLGPGHARGGLDDDGPDVFDRTVEWGGVGAGIETATFHIMTPYPGTALFDRIEGEERIGRPAAAPGVRGRLEVRAAVGRRHPQPSDPARRRTPRPAKDGTSTSHAVSSG